MPTVVVSTLLTLLVILDKLVSIAATLLVVAVNTVSKSSGASV